MVCSVHSACTHARNGMEFFLSGTKTCSLASSAQDRNSNEKNRCVVNIKMASTTNMPAEETNIRGQKKYHPFRLFNDRKIVTNYEDRLDHCVEYLCNEASAAFCVTRLTKSKNKVTDCCCLHSLQENEDALEAVARYMLFFHSKSKTDRQLIVMEWLKYTKLVQPSSTVQNDDNDTGEVVDASKTKYFLLPFLKDEDNDDVEEEADTLSAFKKYWICASALSCILNFGII